jgi:hypothetical protein
MDDNKSKEYILLSNLEQKTAALSCCACLLSLNGLSLSIAVDAIRLTKLFELMLRQWQGCLPLGDARDVNFPLWGDKIWDMIMAVCNAYRLSGVDVNKYEYEADSYLLFMEKQAGVDAMADSIEPFKSIAGSDVPVVTVSALRKLSETLMNISEFLNSPTEEQIAASFEQWEACYRKHYSKNCQRRYKNWKIQYSPRALKKSLQERTEKELEGFKQMFLSNEEFEMVYDEEQKRIDTDGLSRFLFTHAERFGVSYIDARPMLSKELLRLFNFLETWRLMQADLSQKKRTEKPAEPADELEQKVMALVKKVEHLGSEQWRERLPAIWKQLFKDFRNEIAKAGPHEKFREFSKKTLYCILGHMKSKGMYLSQVTNKEMTIELEGANNGMRKYVNNGLTELHPELRKRISAHVDRELQSLAVGK